MTTPPAYRDHLLRRLDELEQSLEPSEVPDGGEMFIAKDLEILSQPVEVPVKFGRGSCALALTTPPFAMMAPATYCWVFLADWLPDSARVGMFVTFLARQPAVGPAVYEVHSVSAVEEMRGNPDPDCVTTPVALGAWLFRMGYLTRHSPDRTDRGDRWARQVGGELPVRDQLGTADDAERSGAAAIDRLNKASFLPPPWPPMPT